MSKLLPKIVILLCFFLGCRTGLIFAQDINIDMYINGWQKSLPVTSHGTMTERTILTPGDPLNPSKPGAVLSICKRFSRGVLESHVVTNPLRISGEQEILYIVRGKGCIEAGMQKEQLIAGTAVLIPPDLEFTLTNECEEPLELLLLIEPFPANKTPRKDILARNYHNLPVNAGGHWSHIVRGKSGGKNFEFGPKAKASLSYLDSLVVLNHMSSDNFSEAHRVASQIKQYAHLFGHKPPSITAGKTFCGKITSVLTKLNTPSKRDMRYGYVWDYYA